jgi:hypothetical protein
MPRFIHDVGMTAGLAKKTEMSRVWNSVSQLVLNWLLRDCLVPLKGFCFHPRTSNGHPHRAPLGRQYPCPFREGSSLSVDGHLLGPRHEKQPRE